MECLVDFVGLRPCGYIPSQSGMYLDQLPGISLPEIDGIADDEQVSWAGVWADVQATAKITFKEDIIQEFNKRWELKQITQTVDFGRGINTSQTTTPVGGTQYGKLLETKLPQSQCACSNLQKFYIQSASFYFSANPMPANPSITYTFVDADLGTTVYTATQTAVAGWNTLWLDQEFDARRLYAYVSGNFTEYVTLDISNFFLNTFGSTYAAPYGYGASYSNGWFWAYWGGCGCQSRVTGAQVTNGTNAGSTNTYGLSIVFSTRCSYDPIVCSNKKHFADAWRHCLAIELLNYRINSPRLNRWTTTDKQQAKTLQKLFEIKYRGGVDKDSGIEYTGKLYAAINSITLNDADCCLRTNAPYIWRENRL